MTRIQFPDRQPPEKPKPTRKRGLRRVAPDTAALKRKTDPIRHAFVEAVGTCMACQIRQATDPHEIARGYAREAALSEPKLQMALCRKCHDLMDDYTLWPPEKQLSRRILWEIQQTVKLYNEARGTAQTHITADNIICRLMFMRKPKPRKKKDAAK